jgi:hypothetical protein
MPYEELKVMLLSIGIPDEHIVSITGRLKVKEGGEMQFIDFLSYIPLFIQMHHAIVINPLAATDEAGGEDLVKQLESFFKTQKSDGEEETDDDDDVNSLNDINIAAGPMTVGGAVLNGPSQRRLQMLQDFKKKIAEDTNRNRSYLSSTWNQK